MIKLVSKDWTIDNIDTVLFDKDGTFIDLHYFWGKMTELRSLKVIETFQLNPVNHSKICEILGYNIETKKMIPEGITALYSRVKIIEIFVNKLKDFNIYTTEKEITYIFDKVSIDFYSEIEKYTKPIENAIDFIKELRKNNIKIGVVTSDSVVSTELTIKNFNWESLFDIVIGRETSEYTKESGIPTKIALEALNSSLENTVMIGDAPMDYISAKNAGIKNTILVSTGQISSDKLRETSPFVIESLKDLECLKI